MLNNDSFDLLYIGAFRLVLQNHFELVLKEVKMGETEDFSSGTLRVTPNAQEFYVDFGDKTYREFSVPTMRQKKNGWNLFNWGNKKQQPQEIREPEPEMQDPECEEANSSLYQISAAESFSFDGICKDDVHLLHRMLYSARTLGFEGLTKALASFIEQYEANFEASDYKQLQLASGAEEQTERRLFPYSSYGPDSCDIRNLTEIV